MSINKKWLNGIDNLKEQYKSMGHEEFVRIYGKYELFIGVTDEIDAFFKHVLTENKKWKEEEK